MSAKQIVLGNNETVEEKETQGLAINLKADDDLRRLETGQGQVVNAAETFPPRNWRQRLSEDVDTSYAYIPLLICCFATGLTDSTLYNAYGTFVSMQTGNTIFIALGASGQNNRHFGWLRSLISLVTFVFGCLSFARMHQLLGGGKVRRTIIVSFSFQVLFVLIAAASIESHAIDGSYPSHVPPGQIDWKIIMPIMLMSFQAGGQIVNSRGLGFSEVPTVVLTSMLCDMIIDPRLFAPLAANRTRNNRAIGFILTLSGAIVGGFLSKYTGRVQNSLWFVMAIKVLVTAGLPFWPPERS